MKNHTFPYFGQLDCNHLDGDYDADWELGDKEIDLDLHFQHKSIDQNGIDNLQYFLDHIETYNTQNQVFIQHDFENNKDGIVKEYLDFHLAELDSETLKLLINADDNSIPLDQQLFKKLKLKRVGLYPDGQYETNCFAIFDYSIGRDYTNLLVVLNTNHKGEISAMMMES
jgi:hypothetical protein